MSHQDTTRESKSPDCASTLTLIITPALRGVGRYQAYLDGDDRVLCVSRAPFLDAARLLIAAGHDADAILEMYRPDASSWDLRAPLQIAAQLDVAETPFGPKFVRHRRPIEGGVDCKDTFVCGHCTVALVHAALNFERATRSPNDTCKFDQDAIADPPDNTTALFSNLQFPKIASKRIDPREGPFLISTY